MNVSPLTTYLFLTGEELSSFNHKAERRPPQIQGMDGRGYRAMKTFTMRQPFQISSKKLRSTNSLTQAVLTISTNSLTQGLSKMMAYITLIYQFKGQFLVRGVIFKFKSNINHKKMQ